MSALTTLYYPWAAIQKRESLKKALVYFDKVIIICEERVLARVQDDLPPVRDLITFLDETKGLRDAGLLELVSPEEVMAPVDARSVVYASVVDDLNDAAFVKLKPPFAVYGDDFGLIDIGDRGAMAMLNTFLVDFYAQDYISFKYNHGYAATFLFQKFVEYDLPENIRRIYDPLLNTRGLGVAHFVQAFSISQALFIAMTRGASLFTDDPFQEQYLRLKYNRSVKAVSTLKEQSRPSALQSFQIKNGHIVHRLLESLPDMTLDSFEDVLSIRHMASDDLARFRTAINKYAAKVRVQPFEPGFDDAIEELVQGEINPAIADLRAKLTTSRDKLLQRVFKKAQSSTGVIPFAISLFAHLPLAATLMVSAATIGLDAAIDTYFERREIREGNGLSFLFNFEQH